MSTTPIPDLKKTRLGSQGAIVSRIGLGCLSMSEMYGEPNQEESIATIHRALELGIDFFDTADIYGFGENEKLLGRALKGSRHNVFIANKFGYMREENSRFGYAPRNPSMWPFSSSRNSGSCSSSRS